MRDVLTAGDTLDFVTALPDYPTSDGWVLWFRLLPRTAGTAIDLETIAAGDDHRAVATAATTSNWTAGEYTWASYVVNGATRYSVASGTVTVLPDPATATAYDGRSAARIALDAVEAVIGNRATLDQEQYSIAGRSLQRTPMADLLRLRSALRIDVAREEAANRRKLGLDDGRRIYLRAGNA